MGRSVTRVLDAGKFCRSLSGAIGLGTILLIAACGGGGGNSAGPPATIGDFALVVEFPTVTVQQQGATQFQTMQVNSTGGFAGTVNVTLQGLPSGVSVLPAGPYQISAGKPLAIALSASTAAAVGQMTITAFGTSGSLSHSVSFSVNVQLAAPFHLTLSPASLSLTPASSANVLVTVVPNSGMPPNVMLSFPDPPQNSGLRFFEQAMPPAPNQNVLTVQADITARPLQNFQLTITATDTATNNTSVATVPLSVAVPFPAISAATRSFYIRTDQDISGAVYDPARKLIFATIRKLNEVRVLSSTDGTLRATIPVTLSEGIDESQDGKQVLVGGSSSSLAVIDPDLLQVVRTIPAPAPADAATSHAFFCPRFLSALSSGQFLILGYDCETTESHIFFFDPSTNSMTQRDQSSFPNPVLLTRSGDRSKVLLFGSTSSSFNFLLYDAVTDTFTGPGNVSFPAAAAALNPNGTQMAVLSNGGVTFLDHHFNQLASVSLFDTVPAGLIYSLDGRFLYVLAAFGGISPGSQLAQFGVAIDTQSFGLLGLFPDFNINVPNGTRPLAIDGTGMIFGANLRGLGFLDVSTPGAISLPVFHFQFPAVMSPSLLSLTSSVQTQISGAFFDPNTNYGVFLGGPPASSTAQIGTGVSVQNSNFVQITAPSGTKAGAASVTLTRPDGWYQVAPDAVSYGPQVLFLDANAGPAAGGSQALLYGYGMDTNNIQVLIGSNAATIAQVATPGSISPFPFGMDVVHLTTPPGSPGLADVTVSTPHGSTTIAGGYQYLANAQVFPMQGTLEQIIYDRARQRLYVSNQDHNRVEIFSLASQSFLTPVSVGNGPLGLALTPDGQRLAVVNSGDGTVSVIDPAQMKVLATESVVTSADANGLCKGQPISITSVEPHRLLVDVLCRAALGGGNIHLLDIDSGSLVCAGVAGCDSSGLNIVFGSGQVAMASMPDASKVFFAESFILDGQVGILDLNANTLTTASRGGGSFADAAVDADGNRFAAQLGIVDSGLSLVSVPQDVDYRQAGGTSFNNVNGEKLNSSGSLLFIPQQASPVGPSIGVDIFDVHRERLGMRVALPEPIPITLNSMALDETGSKMFLISRSGITIAQLSQVPLSLASVRPSSGPVGTQVILRGSGFVNGATVIFGKSTPVPAVFVDADTLQVTVPGVSPGTLRVIVTNPDGRQYSFDAAFTVN